MPAEVEKVERRMEASAGKLPSTDRLHAHLADCDSWILSCGFPATLLCFQNQSIHLHLLFALLTNEDSTENSETGHQRGIG